MIEVVRYTADKKEEWDKFVEHSKTDCFMFLRDYMDYHADRFSDLSLMVYNENSLCMLIPANQTEDTLYSHLGLTFGGFVSTKHANTKINIELFYCALKYLKGHGIKKVIYKTQPNIYKKVFGDEDQYIMFISKATLTSRLMTSVIDFSMSVPYSKDRVRNFKKSIRKRVYIKESDNLQEFWEIVEANLKHRHNTKPVHSYQEIKLLQHRFPKRIRLLSAYQDTTMVGGALIYLFDHVVKVQYAHASPLGKSLGANDALYMYLINEYKSGYRYLDFGTSNEAQGRILNEGLLYQKEGFGARTITMDTYQINLDEE